MGGPVWALSLLIVRNYSRLSSATVRFDLMSCMSESEPTDGVELHEMVKMVLS